MNVYSLVIYGDKILLWRSLSQFLQKGVNGRCIIKCDFRMTLIPSEKRGVNNIHDPLREHMDLLSYLDLINTRTFMGHLIWLNKRLGKNPTTSHLDRFLVSSDLLFQDKKVMFMLWPHIMPIIFHPLTQNIIGIPLSFNIYIAISHTSLIPLLGT